MAFVKATQPSKEIIDYLLSMPAEEIADQLLKKPPPKARKVFNHYNISKPFELVQLDILYLTNDNNFKYALCCVDAASRYKWAEALKDTKSSSVLKAFQDMKLPIDKIKTVNTDGGAEFKGVFHNFLIENNIRHQVNKIGYHPHLVENMNLHLAKVLYKKQMIKELQSGEPNLVWVRDLESEIQNMNYEINDAIGMEPYKALRKEYVPQPLFKKNNDMLLHYNVGDIVRILLEVDQYIPIDVGDVKKLERRRATDTKYSIELYYVYDYFNNNGEGYYYHRVIPITKPAKKENIFPHRFTYFQLQKINIPERL